MGEAAKWVERAAEIRRLAPPIGVAKQQYVVKALPVLDHVAVMSAPPSDIRERGGLYRSCGTCPATPFPATGMSPAGGAQSFSWPQPACAR